MPARVSDNPAKVYDYIIVGAGSAGCVMANRLSQDPNKQVLLIEAGGKDSNPWIHIPIGYFKTMNHPTLDWCFKTESDPGLNNRSIAWPRGKVLGGSSSLNGLLYIRGQSRDYDDWASQGNSGWSYKDVLPYFIKSENNERGADQYHGTDGELCVSNIRVKREICDLFIDAAEQVGIPRNNDFNGAKQEGVGYFQLNIDNKGLRSSTSVGFLKPVMHRKNLTVITNALVHKVNFEAQRTSGISYSLEDVETTAQCSGEVVMCAGAVGSPHILMLSGVGHKDELAQHNIKTVKHLPGVGKNLQDHLQIRTVYKIKKPMTINDELRNPLRKLSMGIEYALFRTGPLTMAASQVAIFTKTDESLDRPNIQYHLQPLSADNPAEGTHKFSAFTASVCQLRPTSRGHLQLKSANPAEAIAIHPNYLATEQDQKTAIQAIKHVRKVTSAPALKELIETEHEPGEKIQTDHELLEYARNRSTTIYHPTGTCKMGPSTNDMNVVNDRLQVHGLHGLRIADCSIMPDIISGNTNAAAIMIAEKAADMIKQDCS